MARAPGCPSSLQVEGGCGKGGTKTAKSLCLSLSLLLPPPSRSWLRVQEATKAEKAKQDGGKWPGEPKTSPFSSYLFTMTGASVAMAQIYRIECSRFCCHRRMGPTTAESPTRARSDKCGTVTGVRDATVVLSHPSAAAHAASSARGCRLKRRAHTTPHESGHVAHHRRKTHAHDSRLRVVSNQDGIFLQGSIYPQRNHIPRPY